MDIVITFGATSPTIGNQLREQGLKYDIEKIKLMQQMAFQISMLRIHSILSEEDSAKARDRLYGKICNHVKKANK